MKKTVSVILTSVMLFSQGVFANAEDSMEDVLISVKEKVDIPDSLTEFDTTTSTGRSEGYSFNWSNEDGSINISVSCDLTVISNHTHTIIRNGIQITAILKFVKILI